MNRSRNDAPRISPEQARAMLQDGEAIILDVVATNAWPSMTHVIKGSIRIPPDEIGRRYKELPRDKTVIAYCT